MSNTISINDNVTVSGQPTADELKQLPQKGFQSVINFRTNGEEDQPISPFEEGQIAQECGLKYHHIPVSMKSMTPEVVDAFREAYQQMPKPVFAHCKSGKRAGAMVMMHMAVQNGMTGDQTLEKAEAMGFECDKPELRDFVKQYVDSHQRVS
ncbi:protein tyrosine phosphatase family protein [Bremerella sp. T1]|uniref:beta-lactamase hydrolase domain-containing protein n=1 Tax=Bremerella sp. TYQ1 TaxID=3119568 RepID=UPI001CC8FB67|nr:protein tyrosine phosphatase family protein [Bremerella volcania]UBM34037.1 protein tyrosine phosphatase family protein [Bremerella volcania]